MYRFEAKSPSHLKRLGVLLMVLAGAPGCFMLALAGAPHMLGPMLQLHGWLMLGLFTAAGVGLFFVMLANKRDRKAGPRY